MEPPRPRGTCRPGALLLALCVSACSLMPRAAGPPPGFRPPVEVAAGPGAITRVSFSPDGGRIAAGGEDNAVRVFRADTWGEEGVLETSSRPVRDIGWNPGGNRLAAVTDEGLHVYEIPSRKEIRFVRVTPAHPPGESPRPGAYFPEFLWEPGGDRIAVSGFDNAVVRVYAGADLGEEVALRGHHRAVTSMEWGPEGRLYTASRDGTVRRWDVVSGEGEFLTPNLGEGGIRITPLGATGTIATVAYGDTAILVWNSESGELQERVSCSSAVALFRVSGDGRRAGIADTYRSVWIRELPGWKVDRVLTAEGIVEDLRWSPDGRYLAGKAGGDPGVVVWDVATGGAVHLRVPEDGMIAMGWSPDGRRLVTGSRTGKIREWALTP